MSLYNRDYIHNQAAQRQEERAQQFAYEEPGVRSEAELADFIKKTYQLFAASCLAGAAGAYLGMGMAASIAQWYIGLVILEFAMLFGLYLTRKKPGLNMVMLFGFTFLTGITLVPLLAAVGMGVVAQAFFLTALISGGLSLYAMQSTRDFSSWGKPLLIALVILVVGSLINLFLGSPMLQVVIASAGALLFSFMIIYDTQMIIRGAFATPVEAAIAIYLDVLNLFISLLQILGIFGSDE
ncbi:Bax inhibitor-1/YccA family protein [Hydrogenimonas urashimensis]|uniref:Bax inhibitor-1/YccA family protein n=1 Tax=Hydrogenimonas urashimensis TaxID=2740515 RepID=UPI00191655CC|nr:Bax inhibitor-1/YccA family protein [Hydrogenimonas urashimensis]